MKTIKIIDLINKIANGEEVPNKIKYDGIVYEDEPMYFIYEAIAEKYEKDFKNFLNDEVEILEEKKIPEKLEEFDIQGLEVSGYSMTQAEYLLEDGIKENREMLNWILDYLESKEKGE